MSSRIRRLTREFLLQSLYARTQLRDRFDRQSFLDATLSEGDHSIDLDLFSTLEIAVLDREDFLLACITRLAPKFDISTMPILHLLILIIAMTELLSFTSDDLTEAMIINEAIEMTKRFSDTQGKNFVNGTLSSFLKQKEELLVLDLPPQTFHLFS